MTAGVRDYFSLFKPRVMSLVVFTSCIGLFLAPEKLPPTIAFLAILAIAIGAGASGALNMWYDTDIDRLMTRTLNRPLPSGRIPKEHALFLGVLLSIFSVGLLGILTNWVSAGLLAFTIFFYSVIYTIFLKRLTPQNIVIGGAAGAFPPMIGWAAATGAISFESFLLFLIIFLWTPPHFWALSLVSYDDYRKARIPMLPVVSGIKATQTNILIYTVLLSIVSFIPVFTGFLGEIYAVIALVLNFEFIRRTWQLYGTHEKMQLKKRSRNVFAYSLVYLFVLYLAMLVDSFLKF